jgi:hypothetical protein
VHHLLGAKAVLEHLRRGFHRAGSIAASQMKIERDVGVLAALYML